MEDVKGKDGDHIIVSCGVPTCNELQTNAKSACLIKSLATPQQEMSTSATDPAYNEYTTDHCYIESEHHQFLLNPQTRKETHFGFWFNPPDAPTGPSAKDPRYENFCVKNRPLGAFFNNTAHSMQQYSIWVFTDLTPTTGGVCGDTQAKAITFGQISETLPGIETAIAQADRESMFGFLYCR